MKANDLNHFRLTRHAKSCLILSDARHEVKEQANLDPHDIIIMPMLTNRTKPRTSAEESRYGHSWNLQASPVKPWARGSQHHRLAIHNPSRAALDNTRFLKTLTTAMRARKPQNFSFSILSVMKLTCQLNV